MSSEARQALAELAPPPGGLASPLRQALALAAVLALGAACYARVLHGEFVFDDERAVAGNAAIKGLGRLWAAGWLESWRRLGRPVVDLTLALDYQVAGLDPFAFHLHNLVVHLVAVVAVWALARAVLRRAAAPRASGVALVVAAFFALHPLQSQAVSYVSQRAESLASLLYVAGLLALLRLDEARRPGARVGWLGAALAAMLAGLGCKAIVVTLPVAWLFLSAAFPPPRDAVDGPRRALLRRLAWASPLLAVAAWFSRSAEGVLSGGRDAGFSIPGLTPWEYLLTQARVLWLYLRLLVLPVGQTIDRQVRVSRSLAEFDTAAAALALLGLVVAAAWAWRWSSERAGHPLATAARVGSFAVGWFLLLLAPTSLVPLVDVAVEHRVYLAAFGPMLAAVVLADALLSRAPGAVRLGAALAACAALALTLHARNAVWESRLALWRDAVTKAPGKARPHLSLATALEAAGATAEALAHFRRAEALLDDGSVEPPVLWRNLGAALVRSGRAGEALAVLERASARYPADADLLNNLGVVLLEVGRTADAEAAARRALAIRPEAAQGSNTLGEALLARGDVAGAVDAFGRAAALDPDAVPHHYNLAVALEAGGRGAEACRAWDEVSRRSRDPADLAAAREHRDRLGCGPRR